MRVLKTTNKLCLSCMKKHLVKEIEVVEDNIFRNENIEFKAVYEYCTNTEEYIESEEMIRINDLSMKDAYRKKMNLLTSVEIKEIREKYCISQKDFSDILGWSKATITRYENHQVQDIAYDDILRKIDSDPNWFLQLLKRAEGKLSPKMYNKYLSNAKRIFSENRNSYLIDSIHATYAVLDGDGLLTGKAELNLDKVIEMINYLALKVENLHKVKLAKMLWYSDALNYKRTGSSITGLAYRALPLGAVPEAFDKIILLNGIFYDEFFYNTNIGYKFRPAEGFKIVSLIDSELKTIDDVISLLGDMNTEEIVTTMHGEVAYECTDKNSLILFNYACELAIS